MKDHYFDEIEEKDVGINVGELLYIEHKIKDKLKIFGTYIVCDLVNEIVVLIDSMFTNEETAKNELWPIEQREYI